MSTLEFELQVAGPSSVRLDACDSPLSFQTINDGIRLVVQFLDEDGLPLNIRTLGGYKIRLKKPDETSADFVAALLTNGTDGKIYYDLAVADSAQFGPYNIQGFLGSGATLRTTRLGKFSVIDNIETPA